MDTKQMGGYMGIKTIDGWMDRKDRWMDGQMFSKKIDGWLDGYKLIYEIIYGWLDVYKNNINQMNGWIEKQFNKMDGWWLVDIKKWMVGQIKQFDEKNRWMVE